MPSQRFHGLHSKLQEEHCGTNVQTIFVTVPSVSLTRHEERLGEDSVLWLKSVACKIAPDSAVYCFDHGLIADEDFEWQSLLNEGDEFLDALMQFQHYEELQGSSIILLAHSLGGAILKRALRLAYQQYSRFKDLLSSIAGIVLFGTPHSRFEATKSWQNASLILKYSSKNRVKEVPNNDMLRELANDCRCFETTFESVPVLSAFETQQTRVPTVLGGTKTIVVGRECAKTNTRLETLVALEADHGGMCHVSGACPGISSVVSFISRALESALETREMKRPPNNRHPATPPASSQFLVPTTISRNLGVNSMAASFGNMTLLTESQTERTDPQLPCHLMPLARNRGFFGRQDVLEEIEDALLPKPSEKIVEDWHSGQPTSLKSYALCGIGGLGKTQIAVEYIYSREEKYDAIFWVQADEYAKLAQGFYHIAINLGLIAENSADARDHMMTREVVKSWLKNPVKSYKAARGYEAETTELATWLLVFDNVDETEILDDFWPNDSTGSVLITSHDPLAKTQVANTGMILDAFNAEESTEFLLKLTNREGEVEEQASGNAVAKMLGGLPLALTQMAGVIARRDLSFAEFLQVYDKESSHKELFSLPIRPTKYSAGYQHTLASVWAIETLSESAVLLDVLSLLDSDGIQERILEAHRENILLPGYPKTNAAYQIARTELLRCSLITRDRGTKKIMMHRLIQDAARTKMTPERLDSVFRATVSLLSAVWPFEEFDWRHGVSSRTQCEDLFPHVIRLRKLSEGLIPSTAVTELDLEFPRLLTDAGWFSHERGNAPESEPFFNLAQSICEYLQTQLLRNPPQNADLISLSQKLDFLLGEIHYNNGCIATEANKAESALKQFTTFNKMMLKQFGPDGTDLRLAISWNELGNGLMMNKRREEAIECFLQSCNTLRKRDDFNKISLSFPLVNLGFAYWILGRLEEADIVCSDALEARKAAFGEDDAESFITGKLLHIFGNVRASQGRMEESFNFHNRALLQYRKFTVGKNHHRTADVCIKVADHYVRLKQYPEASTFLNQALKIYGDRDNYVPERARAQFKKAKLLTEMGGQAAAADTWFVEAMKLYRKLKPGDCRSVNELTDDDFDDMITFWSR